MLVYLSLPWKIFSQFSPGFDPMVKGLGPYLMDPINPCGPVYAIRPEMPFRDASPEKPT